MREAIRGHQVPDEGVDQKGHQRVHQRHSGAIIGNQWQSAYANPCGPVAMSGSRYALRSIVISPFSSNTLITWYAQHGSARHEVAILA